MRKVVDKWKYTMKIENTILWWNEVGVPIIHPFIDEGRENINAKSKVWIHNNTVLSTVCLTGNNILEGSCENDRKGKFT